MYPQNYGEEEGEPGWYNYAPEPYTNGAMPVWFWSMKDADKKLIAGDDWVPYLGGDNPGFPVESLQREFSELRPRVERMHRDTSSPDTRMSDDPMGANPAVVTALTQQTVGGLDTAHYGFPLYSRLRYFDPERRRPGIPRTWRRWWTRCRPPRCR